MERFNFNNEFEMQVREVLQHAEYTPAPEIWERIEGGLSAAGTRRGGLTLIQIAAAIGLVFAAAISLWNAFGPASESKDGSVAGSDVTEIESQIVEDMPKDLETTKEEIAGNLGEQESQVPPVGPETDPSVDSHINYMKEESREQAPATSPRGPTFESELAKSGWDLQRQMPGDPDPYMIPYWVESDILKESVSATRWASAGYGTGSFSPTTDLNIGFAKEDQASPQSLSSGSPQAFTMDEAGNAQSFGIAYGGRFGRKWTLESGLSYRDAEFFSTSNATVQSGGSEFIFLHDSPESGVLNTVTPYQITNSLRFLGVPLKAGYFLIDRRFSWALNAGVSTNFLLSNSATSTQPGLDGTGTNPYRTVSLSSLFGTEIYYLIGDHFQAGVAPQFVLGLTDLTTTTSTFSVRPNSAQVVFSLRYLIK